MSDLICQFCSSLRKNKNSLINHERLCKSNPNRKYVNNWPKDPWNKGLTKEIDSRVVRNSESVSKVMKAKIASGDGPGFASPNFWTEERREQKSKWRKNLHSSNPELHPNRKLANNRSKISYPEQIAFDWLTKHGYKFEHQKRISNFFVDFCIDTLIIEIDGEYWHPIGNVKDQKRDELLSSLGYNVHRIRTKERIEERLENILRP